MIGEVAISTFNVILNFFHINNFWTNESVHFPYIATHVYRLRQLLTKLLRRQELGRLVMAKFSVRPKPTLSGVELYIVSYLKLSLFCMCLYHYVMC